MNTSKPTFNAVQDLDSEALDNILYEDGLDWSYEIPDSKEYDIIYIFKNDEKLMDEELDKLVLKN
jgi:predicted RNA-binding protein associated with RNAse of E/G family|tara:strand:- start:2122 stop:2316 length:195 start_codon:yes stop_codon:yes gene_type:complete